MPDYTINFLDNDKTVAYLMEDEKPAASLTPNIDKIEVTLDPVRIKQIQEESQRISNEFSEPEFNIQGNWRDDGTFIGFNYTTQQWVDTSKMITRLPDLREGSASNPLWAVPIEWAASMPLPTEEKPFGDIPKFITVYETKEQS